MVSDSVERLGFTPHVKGHVTVDVIEGGQVVDHAEHDNYVSPFVYDALRKACNAQFMLLKHSGGYANTVVEINDFMKSALNVDFVLTDYAGAVNTRERVIHGTPLSYGYYRYLSNAANECSFNSDESYQRQNAQRFVFDFSTSQGNGTFQSIYSCPSSDSTLQTFSTGYALFRASDTYDIAYHDKQIFLATRSGIKIISIDTFLTGLQGSGWPDAVTVDTGHNIGYCIGITTDGTNIYWVESNQYKAHKAPLTDLTNVTDINIADVYILKGITYSALRDSLFVSIRTPSDAYEIREYSTDFTLKKSFPTTNTNSLIALPEENSLIVGTRVYDIDDNANALKPSARWKTSDAFTCGGFANGIGVFSGSNNPYLGLYLGSQYFSRARLDKPVTKNSRQTMKITYDFTMPEIDWEN